MSDKIVFRVLLIGVMVSGLAGRFENDSRESADHNLEESGERVGAQVSQVCKHPYAASLLRQNAYVCSAVVLNRHWLLTVSKCFETDIISAYITSTRSLSNYTIRVGSSYNQKGGSIYKIRFLTNSFDMKVSVVKLQAPLEYSTRVAPILLPDEDIISLGYLVQLVAWTPNGHMRIVNAPVISSHLCESTSTLQTGHYICVGGVQDPDRHFCRRDNGGAVVQNNTLIGITTFINVCAKYSKVHAFPKMTNITSWLNTVIWDEEPRPTTTPRPPKITTVGPSLTPNVTTVNLTIPLYPFEDSNNYKLTLPFDPISVPLEPAMDNSVLPRMSFYESYLKSLSLSKTSTTTNPSAIAPSQYNKQRQQEWMKKVNKAFIMMAPPAYTAKKYVASDEYPNED